MNTNKLIQVVNYVLQKFDGRLNYTKLIKLLYLADREAISKTDYSITGDTYSSMQYGPVLNNLYSFINNEHKDILAQSQWNVFFYKDSFILIALQKILPISEMSRFEMNVLDETVNKYRNTPYTEMINVTHDKNICPEWKDPYTLPIPKPSIPLSKSDILRCLGRSEEYIKDIEDNDEIYAENEKYFI